MKIGEPTFITQRIGNRILVDMVDLYNLMLADPDGWYDRFYKAMDEAYKYKDEL